MIGNNSSIKRFFKYKIYKPFNKMYSKNAFIHWYTAEGMETSEFDDAKQDLKLLLNEYKESLKELDDDEDF